MLCRPSVLRSALVAELAGTGPNAWRSAALLVVHTELVLLKFIAEVADEPLVLDPGNREAESQANTWWLSADPEERATLSVEEIAAAFEHTAEALRARVCDRAFSGTVTFYVWHDVEAGQLRCSTTSQLPEELPFGGAHVVVGTLEPVIVGFLDDGEPCLIPWADLVVRTGDQVQQEDEPTPQPFPV